MYSIEPCDTSSPSASGSCSNGTSATTKKKGDGGRVVGALLEEFGVGHDQFDPRQVGSAEGNAAIDDDPFARALGAEAIGGHVHADLAGAAQRQEQELVGLARFCARIHQRLFR